MGQHQSSSQGGGGGGGSEPRGDSASRSNDNRSEVAAGLPKPRDGGEASVAGAANRGILEGYGGRERDQVGSSRPLKDLRLLCW